MTHPPTAATTRRPFAALAAEPHPDAAGEAADELRKTAEGIRAFLTAADHEDTPTVPTAILHQWRCDLDRHHRALEHTTLDTWTRWRLPGTWLDSHLRLRSLIAHEVGKAYWDDTTDIRYDAIDIERYRWGARGHHPGGRRQRR